MNIKKNHPTVLLLTVIIYCLMAFSGFSLLSHFGIYYNGTKIHIYAIPMMLIISFYVYFINGKHIFKKDDFIPRKGNYLLYLIPYIVGIAVLSSIIETIITKRSLPDILCMAVLTFFIGISEEGMFRLFILKDCGDFLKMRLFLFVFSSLTFAALHMMNVGGGLSFYDAFIQSANALPFGLLTGFLFLRTGNISSLVFWHMFFDYDLFAAQQGIYITTTVLGYVVEFVIFLSLICAIIQMISEWKQKGKEKRIQ